jgi:CheY-like chemotaxis protein
MTTGQAATEGANCVLIVDDEEGVRESLRDVVEMLGCSAVLAGSAEDALELLAARPFCLVVLDLLMPGMTGAELLVRMRGESRFAQVPVLISTSAPERAPRGVPLLPKPVDFDALSAWMERLCHCRP